jgi:glucose-6-phosphate isomerase
MTTNEVAALAPVRAALEELAEREAVRRLHERDTALFSDDPAVQEAVGARLGWLDVMSEPPSAVARVAALRDAVRASGLRRVVLAGMGGSSLAPEVFARVYAGSAAAAGGLALDILDSTHPDAVATALPAGRMDDTLVVVASKSGTTEETRCFGALAASAVPDSNHLLAITDPGSALEAEAFGGRWRDVFLNPPDIGGRFSALSYFGMLPAALAGVPVAQVWERAAAMAVRCAPAPERAPADDPAALLGAFMGGLARAGRDKLTLLAHPRVAALGDWIEQLVAESTGKHGRGVIPIVGEPPGAPAAYGHDRAFVELRFGGARAEGAAELAAAGLPLLALDIGDEADLGAAYVQWELATAYAGVLLEVNPFDEPNVTESKRNTTEVLEDVAAGLELPVPGPGDLDGLLARVKTGDYVALQAYLPMTDDAVAALTRARRLVRDRLRVATTVGFGPRFLHSTGQLHKGGPDTLVAVQLADVPSGGPQIPGRPYDFATLVRAQATGDLQALESHGRRVAQLRVEPAELEAFVSAVAAALPA